MMKNLKEILNETLVTLNETLVTESAAKNIHQPRKGSTVYLLKDGESKAIAVNVIDVKKSQMYKGDKGSYYIYVYLAENEYGIDMYSRTHFSSIDYNDDTNQVTLLSFGEKGGDIYVGTSKEAIQSFVNNRGRNKIQGIIDHINKLQDELDEYTKKKEKAEQEINLQVTESLR